MLSEIHECLGRTCRESGLKLAAPPFDLHTPPGFAREGSEQGPRGGLLIPLERHPYGKAGLQYLGQQSKASGSQKEQAAFAETIEKFVPGNMRRVGLELFYRL